MKNQTTITDVNTALQTYFEGKDIKCINYDNSGLTGYKVTALICVSNSFEILIRDKQAYINRASNVTGYEEYVKQGNPEEVVNVNGTKFVPWPYGLKVGKKDAMYNEKLKIQYAVGILKDPAQKKETVLDELKTIGGSRYKLIYEVVKKYDIISISIENKVMKDIVYVSYGRYKDKIVNAEGMTIEHTKGTCFVPSLGNKRIVEIFTSLLKEERVAA